MFIANMSNTKRISTNFGKFTNDYTFGFTLQDTTTSVNNNLPNLLQTTYNLQGPFNDKDGSGTLLPTNNLVTDTISGRTRNTTSVQISRFVQNISAKGYATSSSNYLIPAWTGTTFQGTPGGATVTHDLSLFSNSNMGGSNRLYTIDSNITTMFKIDSGTGVNIGKASNISTFVGSYRYNASLTPTDNTIAYHNLQVLGKTTSPSGYDVFLPNNGLLLSVSGSILGYTFTAAALVNYSADFFVDSTITSFDVNGADRS
jgi:hypothetical protein